jgi:hypothetical protein
MFQSLLEFQRLARLQKMEPVRRNIEVGLETSQRPPPECRCFLAGPREARKIERPEKSAPTEKYNIPSIRRALQHLSATRYRPKSQGAAFA